ncbi:MAG: class I SAM-dependent DNA methyltransferase [Oscillochloridaceae bacterium umkhey_bin13]
MDSFPTDDVSLPYTRYAPLYDASGQVRFALLVQIYLHEILARHPVLGRRVLDVACGTGTLALLLAEAGWQVTGVDSSAAMLVEAAAKLAGLPQVRLVQTDLRQLKGVPMATFDLVTCTYDSLNYLTSADDLGRAFRAVAKVLAPGGLYVADLNTEHFLAYEWGACAIREQDGYVQIERSTFEPATCTSRMLLTGFVGNDDQGYERFDEVHCERAYPPTQITTLLEAAGLVLEATYDSFTLNPPNAQSQRIFWVARRPETPLGLVEGC